MQIILDKTPGELEGAAKNQLNILQQSGLHPVPFGKTALHLCQAEIVVDALIGNDLRGELRARAAEPIQLRNQHAKRILSLMYRRGSTQPQAKPKVP